MSKKLNKIRGEHGLNFFISYQLKKKLQALARKYDTSLADIVRTLLKIGIPVLEGYKQAQEQAEKDVGNLQNLTTDQTAGNFISEGENEKN